MLKKRRCIFNGISILIVVIIIFVAIFANSKNENFWVISFSQIVTVIVAILIAFYASQFRNDERKLKEVTEKLLYKLQASISSDVFINPSEDDYKKVLMNIKSISNIISNLKKCADNFSFKKDMEYIENQFNEYKEFWGEHSSDYEYIKKSTDVFQKYSRNIESRCDSIIISLYN